MCVWQGSIGCHRDSVKNRIVRRSAAFFGTRRDRPKRERRTPCSRHGRSLQEETQQDVRSSENRDERKLQAAVAGASHTLPKRCTLRADIQARTRGTRSRASPFAGLSRERTLRPNPSERTLGHPDTSGSVGERSVSSTRDGNLCPPVHRCSPATHSRSVRAGRGRLATIHQDFWESNRV